MPFRRKRLVKRITQRLGRQPNRKPVPQNLSPLMSSSVLPSVLPSVSPVVSHSSTTTLTTLPTLTNHLSDRKTPLKLSQPLGSQTNDATGKFALLIACEYTRYEALGLADRLPGCHNDVYNFYDLLIKEFHYLPENITVLADDNIHTEPTRATILHHLDQLLLKCKNVSSVPQVMLYYSGHGSTVPDKNGDEVLTANDQCLIPCDYLGSQNQELSVILDDELRSRWVNQLPSSVQQVFCVFDCCFSGTILDLPYVYVMEKKTLKEAESKKVTLSSEQKQRLESGPLVICLSGCNDEQTSSSVVGLTSAHVWEGALSWGLRQLIQQSKNKSVSLHDMLTQVRNRIRSRTTQLPQLTLSRYQSPSTLWLTL